MHELYHITDAQHSKCAPSYSLTCVKCVIIGILCEEWLLFKSSASQEDSYHMNKVVYVCVCVRVYKYMCAYMRMYLYMYSYTCAYVSTYVYM